MMYSMLLLKEVTVILRIVVINIVHCSYVITLIDKFGEAVV